MSNMLHGMLPSTSDIDFLAVERKAHRLRAEAVATFFSRVGHRLAGWLFGIAKAADSSVDVLYSMSDRELQDIGITRSDIPSIADGSFVDPHGRMTASRGDQEARPAA